MKTESIIAAVVAVTGVMLSISLLFIEKIGEATFLVMLGGTAVVSIVLHGFSRLKEVSLRELKVTLSEVRQAQEKLEKTKAEISEMYGGIEKLQREPLVLDENKRKELGLGSGLAMTDAVMRYSTGCFKRERERLARIFVNAKTPEETASCKSQSKTEAPGGRKVRR